MQEARTFEKNEDGTIKVTAIYKEQEVYVPVNGEQMTIGVQESVVTQTIDKVPEFIAFMTDQRVQAEAQIEKLKKELKDLEHVNEDLIPESMKLDIEKYINKKASKATLKSIQTLNTFIHQVNSKRDRKRWLEHVEKQHKEICEQIIQIEKILE